MKLVEIIIFLRYVALNLNVVSLALAFVGYVYICMVYILIFNGYFIALHLHSKS